MRREREAVDLRGVAAALIFGRIQANEGPLPARQTKTLSELLRILREDRRFSFFLLCFVVFGGGVLMAVIGVLWKMIGRR